MNKLSAGPPPPLKGLVQLLVPGSDPNLRRVSAIRARPSTKASGRVFRVLAPAVVRRDKQRRPSPLRRELEFLVKDPDSMSLSSSLVTSSFADIRSVCCRSRVAGNSSYRSHATRSDQVLYTSYIIFVLFRTDSRSRKRFRLSDGGLVTASAQHPDKLTDQNAHCNGWSVQHIVNAWNLSASSVEINTTRG